MNPPVRISLAPVDDGLHAPALVDTGDLRLSVDRADMRAAVHAWVELGHEHLSHARVELLRRRKKSAAFRLVGVGRGGKDVIAKKCRIETALVERNVYERLSGSLSPVLHCYGFVEEVGDECAWLFVEDAGGVPYNRNEASHRRQATRWLAELHISTANVDLQVPERKAAFYAEHLEKARTTACERTKGLALSAEERGILASVSRMCDAVESRWSSIQQTMALFPRALVHNDFTGRNVRVRHNGHALEVLAFDWEMAGWGLPTIDVLEADLEVYWLHVQPHWRSIDRASLNRAFWIAMLLRNLAAIHWESTTISQRHWEEELVNLDLYLRCMMTARQHLDW